MNGSRITRLTLTLTITSASIALLQASHLRKKYVDRVKLDIPLGPHCGLVKRLSRKDDHVTQTSLAMVQELLQTTNKTMETIRKSTRKPPRKVKLIILGDSLVCGIGCDEGISSSGPVLPQIVAKVLSIAMQADVEWSSTGIVGGTVADMRHQLLPTIKRELSSSSSSSSSEEQVLIVIICGLNDFKQVALFPFTQSLSIANTDRYTLFLLFQIWEKFPQTNGPISFKEELHKLVQDIQSMGKEIPRLQGCRVFLPSIPIVCGRGDATCDIMIRPLDQFVEYICYLWDQQKKDIAVDQSHITYIDHPRLDSEYATPGDGNFCSDGIHPSQQGYQWWGYHIAESILASNVKEYVFRKEI